MDKEYLVSGGFVPTTYDGQDGEFLTKRVCVGNMPHAAEHLIDGDLIFGSSEAVTEIIPGDLVQFHIPDADYLDGPVPVDSDEGQALIRDALAAR